jgi:hypothetical protein
MEAPRNRRFYEKMQCLFLWPTYIGEKGRTLDKTYGIKVRCYWDHPWGTHREHIGNLMGTHWELERNMLGTKENAEPSHWLHEISISKTCLSPFSTWTNTPITN